jgi:hypothetical protein
MNNNLGKKELAYTLQLQMIMFELKNKQHFGTISKKVVH